VNAVLQRDGRDYEVRRFIAMGMGRHGRDFWRPKWGIFAVMIALFWTVSPVFAGILGSSLVIAYFFAGWSKAQWVGIIIGGVLTAITGLLWLS